MTFACTLLARLFNAGNSMLFYSTGFLLLILFPHAGWAQEIAFSILVVTAFVAFFLFGMILLLPKEGAQAINAHFRGNVFPYILLVLGAATLGWHSVLVPFNRIGMWTSALFVFGFLVLAPWAYYWKARSELAEQLRAIPDPTPEPVLYD